MSNVQAVPLIAGAADLDRSAVIRTIDAISASAGFVAAIALAVMTVIVGYEVVSRFVFNAPTTWVTEISTYIFVAIVFLGLAEAQRANAHIKVDLLVDRLSKQTRHFLELIGLWLGLLLIVASAWHMARFTFQEYVHDFRDRACSARRNGCRNCRSPWATFCLPQRCCATSSICGRPRRRWRSGAFPHRDRADRVSVHARAR